jgi:hypothetical protein
MQQRDCGSPNSFAAWMPHARGYAPTVAGFFLYFPSRAQRSGPLRLFVETAKELGELAAKTARRDGPARRRAP